MSTRRMSPRERRDGAIRAHVVSQFSDRVRMLIASATADLYGGPGEYAAIDADYPGFESATREIAREWPVGDLWIDSESECVLESEPEECSEDWTLYSAREVKRAVLDALADYV